MKNQKRKLSIFLLFCTLTLAFSQTLSFADFSIFGKALLFDDVHEDLLGIDENSDQIYDYPDSNIKEGPCGTNAYWSFNEENGTLTVSGSDEMEYFPELAYPHWYFLRDEIKTVKITENVTTVSENAFAYCRNLEKVFLGENVYRVFFRAFRGCSSLKEFIVHEDNETYTTINGFLYSKDKTKLEYAPPSISKSLSIPESTTVIQNNSFEECVFLEEITIPSSVSVIGYSAFAGCKSLKNVYLTGNNIDIYAYAFQDCTSLSEFTIPEETIKLKNCIFLNCSSLKNVYIPNSLKEFNPKAFEGCENISIKISENHPTLCYFEGYLCEKSTKKIILPKENLDKTVFIPEGIEDISDSAFTGRKNIEKIVFPKSLKTIYQNAFSDCENLSEVFFEEGIEEIKYSAFKNCSKLKKVNFPKSLKSIGEHTFYGCSSLNEVTIFSTVESIGYKSFGYGACGCGLDTEYNITFNVEKGSAAEEYAIQNFNGSIKYLDVTTFPEHKYYLNSETNLAQNIPLGEKVIDFISYFDSIGIYIQLISSDRYISTGDKIISGGKEYSVSIKSDIDGDGYISSTDYLRIKSFFLGEFQLEGIYFLAADLNEDEEITSTDYLLLKTILLNQK